MDGPVTQQTLFSESGEPWIRLDDEVFDLRAIIQDCEGIPQLIRAASFTRIDGRFLDRRLFTDLIAQQPPKDVAEGWSMRIWQREKALFPHIGKFLMCVFIRLPGVQYTIEVSPREQVVVHWEWQAA